MAAEIRTRPPSTCTIRTDKIVIRVEDVPDKAKLSLPSEGAGGKDARGVRSDTRLPAIAATPTMKDTRSKVAYTAHRHQEIAETFTSMHNQYRLEACCLYVGARANNDLGKDAELNVRHATVSVIWGTLARTEVER